MARCVLTRFSSAWAARRQNGADDTSEHGRALPNSASTAPSFSRTGHRGPQRLRFGCQRSYRRALQRTSVPMAATPLPHKSWLEAPAQIQLIAWGRECVKSSPGPTLTLVTLPCHCLCACCLLQVGALQAKELAHLGLPVGRAWGHNCRLKLLRMFQGEANTHQCCVLGLQEGHLVLCAVGLVPHILEHLPQLLLASLRGLLFTRKPGTSMQGSGARRDGKLSVRGQPQGRWGLYITNVCCLRLHQ